MNKVYTAVTKNLEMDWDCEDARVNLNNAMRFAENCIRRNVPVKIVCNGELVWASSDWK